MKRWIKRITVCGIGLAVLLLLFVGIEHFRGARALNRRLSELKTAGEVFAIPSLKPKAVASHENAFMVVAQLTNRADAILTNLSACPPLLHVIEPGKAAISWRLEQWQSDEKTTNNWKHIVSDLEEAQELLTLLRSAAQKPAYDSGFDYEKGFLDFQIGPLVTAKQAIQVLSVATLYDLRRQQPSAAHSNLCALVSLVSMQQPEPLVICQLVRYACVALAFNTTWQALQSPDWNDDRLVLLQSAWQQADFARDMGRAMEMERAMTVEFYEQIRRSKAKLSFAVKQRESAAEMADGLLQSFPTRGFVLHWLHIPVWRFSWAAQDELRALNRWQTMIERERFARSNSWAALSSNIGLGNEVLPAMLLEQDDAELGSYDRARYLFSNDSFSITDLVIRKALAAQTLQQLAVTAIAIERYRIASGALPAGLGDLVPKYLPKTPRDSMDGEALRYRRKAETEYILYSVGENGVDDGGDPTPIPDRKSYRQIWDGKDAVWPTAVVADRTPETRD